LTCKKIIVVVPSSMMIQKITEKKKKKKKKKKTRSIKWRIGNTFHFSLAMLIPKQHGKESIESMIR